MLEKALEKKLKTEVEKRGGWAIKFFSVFFTGFPDRIVLLPPGKVWFVEMKKPKGGVLSPRQKWVHRQLNKMGFHIPVIWNETDLQEFLKSTE